MVMKRWKCQLQSEIHIIIYCHVSSCIVYNVDTWLINPRRSEGREEWSVSLWGGIPKTVFYFPLLPAWKHYAWIWLKNSMLWKIFWCGGEPGPGSIELQEKKVEFHRIWYYDSFNWLEFEERRKDVYDWWRIRDRPNLMRLKGIRGTG